MLRSLLHYSGIWNPKSQKATLKIIFPTFLALKVAVISIWTHNLVNLKVKKLVKKFIPSYLVVLVAVIAIQTESMTCPKASLKIFIPTFLVVRVAAIAVRL